MSAVLEARAVITAVDETGKAFTSLKERIAGITKQAEVMNRVLGTVGAVSKNVEAFKLPPSTIADMSKFVETTARVDKTMADVNRSAVAMAGNVGKTSAEVVALSGRLVDAGAKLKAISDFKGTNRGVKDAALAAQKAQQDARILAAKIDATPTPTRSMQAAHLSALTEVRETEQALSKQVAIAATARASLAELGVPVARLSAEEERLKSVLDGTNAALLRQIELERQGAAAAEKAAAAQRLSAEQEAKHHAALVKRFASEDHARHAAASHGGGHDHGFANYALTSAAMAVSAHEIASVIGEGWREGAELQHVRMGLQNAGRTPEEMREIEAAGRKTISEQPTANFTETMKVIAETTQAFGSVHHAIDNLPFMMKTMSVLKAAGGEHIHGSVGDVGRALAKTFEERQTRPEDFEKEASAMIPAMVASGGTFNPEQLYAFAQQAKSALPSLSMRFLSRIAPSLIGAQGGDRAGTALNAFENVVSGKANDKKQAQEWLSLGLLDPKQVIMKNGQATSWKSGAVKDTFLAMTDPLAWSEKYLIPALQKQGVDTNNREAVKQILDTMFRNQNANMFASEVTQAASRARLHKDEDLINKTGDLDTIYKNGLGEFNVAAGALGESLKTLGAAATAPLMHRTAEALSWLAGELNQVSAFALRHPTIAGTAGVGAAAGALGAAGWLGKMLFDGFGLKGSAAALTGSAGAIDAAAARLGAGGGFGGGGGGAAGRAASAAENAAEGAGGGAALNRVVNGGAGRAGAIDLAPTAESVAPAVALEFGAAVIAGGVAVTAAEIIKKSAEAQEPGKGGLYAPITEESRDRDTPDIAGLKIERDQLKGEIAHARAMEKIPGTADADVFARQQRVDQLDAAIAGKERSLADLDAYDSHEARVGRAMMAMRRPEEFGPNIPDGYSARTGYVLPTEEMGPFQPALPDTDRADRARKSDLGGWTHLGRGEDGNALHRYDEMPVGPAPRTFHEARTKDDVTPLPGRGGPVPVQIVGGPTTATAAPPPFHDGWLDGDRAGIEERSRRGAAMFRQDHEGTVGQRMMDHGAEHPDIMPHVDTSGLEAGKTVGTELQQLLAAIAGMVVTPSVNSGAIDAAAAKVRQLAADLAALNKGGAAGGGTSGPVGTSYPQTAPTGRQGGPR